METTMNQETMKRAIEKVRSHCVQASVTVAINGGGVIYRDGDRCTADEFATRLTQGHERRLLVELADWVRASLGAQTIESRRPADILADVDAVLAGEGES